MKRIALIFCSFFIPFVSLCGPARAASKDAIEVGRFSSETAIGKPPSGWMLTPEKTSGRRTDYRLVLDEGVPVVRAESNASSSGLMRRVGIDPTEYPIVEWRWKVSNLLKQSSLWQKSGDDFSARLFLTFESNPNELNLFGKVFYATAQMLYGQYPLTKAISYVWGSREPKGTVASSPYTDRVKTFVLENENDPLNMWIVEERNFYEDYQKAFGENPPMLYSVAIMTDTDNTGASADAYYGDVLFKKAAMKEGPPKETAVQRPLIYDTIKKIVMKPNIDRKGQVIRFFGGVFLLALAVFLAFGSSPWPVWKTVLVISFSIGGLFICFEAVFGWCALKACGLRVPF